MTTRHDRRGCTQPSQHALRAVMGCLAVAAHLALPCAVTAGEQQGEWLVYTSTGMERRAYTAPTTVEVDPPEEVEVPSEVTGTGQGTRLTDVQVRVTEGVGGHPTAGPGNDWVTCLAQDSAGNVWVGTWGGLSRFDGTAWTTFTSEDGLAGNWLTALTLDGHGNLWTVGSGGITRFDGRSWAHYLVAGGGGDIAVTPNGDVWMAGAGTALYRFDGEGWWRYGPEDGLPTPGTTVCVAADQHGAVWASVVADNEPLPRYEVTRFDGRQWTSYDVGIGTYVKEIYADSRDRLWIGDERGLLVFDRDRWRRYSGNQFAGVFAIVEDGDGRHWFGGATEEFGFLWGSTWTFVRGVPAGIAPSALLLDSQGDLWMGSFYYRGLVRICRGDLPTAVGQTPDALVPSVCQLLPAYPNPFNSETHIRFSLERADRISLRVLGTSGQVVATLAQGDYGPGTHQLTWNGRDARGRSVGAGVYLCELAGGVRRVRKLALVR